MISHKCRLVSWLILASRPPTHFLHKTLPVTRDKISYGTVPSFTALAVLLPDYQNLTYLKQQNLALPLHIFNIYNAFFVDIQLGIGFLFWKHTLKRK